MAEMRNEPEMPFRINKRLLSGGCRLPAHDIPAKGRNFVHLRATCFSPDSPAAASWLLPVGFGTPLPPFFSGKTNPTSLLESIKRCKNEPKTNPNEPKTNPTFEVIRPTRHPDGKKSRNSRNEPEKPFRISKPIFSRQHAGQPLNSRSRRVRSATLWRGAQIETLPEHEGSGRLEPRRRQWWKAGLGEPQFACGCQ